MYFDEGVDGCLFYFVAHLPDLPPAWKIPTSHQLVRSLLLCRDQTLTKLSGPLKTPHSFPSSLPSIGCWFCLESQTPVPLSSFSGKTQFPAVNAQIPTHFSKFDLLWHLPLPFALLSKYLVFLSLV